MRNAYGFHFHCVARICSISLDDHPYQHFEWDMVEEKQPQLPDSISSDTIPEPIDNLQVNCMLTFVLNYSSCTCCLSHCVTCHISLALFRMFLIPADLQTNGTDHYALQHFYFVK